MPENSPSDRTSLRGQDHSPEVICLAIMMYVRFPLSPRNVEDLLHERRIDIRAETARSSQRLQQRRLL